MSRSVTAVSFCGAWLQRLLPNAPALRLLLVLGYLSGVQPLETHHVILFLALGLSLGVLDEARDWALSTSVLRVRVHRADTDGDLRLDTLGAFSPLLTLLALVFVFASLITLAMAAEDGDTDAFRALVGATLGVWTFVRLLIEVGRAAACGWEQEPVWLATLVGGSAGGRIVRDPLDQAWSYIYGWHSFVVTPGGGAGGGSSLLGGGD